jgi:hypothetical protein
MYAYIDICDDSSEYWNLDDIKDYCLVNSDPNYCSKNISKNESKKQSIKKRSSKNSAIYNKMKNKDYINSNPIVYNIIRKKILASKSSKEFMNNIKPDSVHKNKIYNFRR